MKANPNVMGRTLFAPRHPWLFAALLGCTRAPSVDATPDPSSKPLPSAQKASTERVCEPIVRCGFWSSCVLLERIDDGRYRVLAGPEPKGSLFRRRHQCSPADADPDRCAIHCSGVDGGPPCLDGLHPEEEACTESMPPRPDAQRCVLGVGACAL